MINKFSILFITIIGLTFYACHTTKVEETKKVTQKLPMESHQIDDGRISLHLNPMQKEHQLSNMREHLQAVQTIISLIAKDEYKKASDVAFLELGSTTEMKLMCASFGNENFENMGINFHKSADEMSEILKSKDKNKSLEALSVTMNYCINCHAVFKQ